MYSYWYRYTGMYTDRQQESTKLPVSVLLLLREHNELLRHGVYYPCGLIGRPLSRSEASEYAF